MARSTRIATVLVLAALVGLLWGWQEFWFFTDDAFIAFRYVANAQAGHGYVWNPPPFRPVEGYTSWLWVVILDWIWRIAGIEPPEIANLLTLALSGVTVVLSAVLAMRVTAGVRSESWRFALVGLVLLGIVSNRTFLAWSSSGLETALFGATVAWWMLEAARVGSGEHRRAIAWAAAAVLTSLARPEGLPLSGLTLAALVVGAVRRDSARHTHVVAAVVLVAPLSAFFAWRWSTYASLLPNTYYAKIGKPWPEAGWRYLGSFVLEYALWAWALVVGAAVIRAVRERDRPAVPVLVAIAGLGYQVAYYTVVAGGDHFEFRAFNHLIPAIHLAFAWALVRVAASPRRGLMLTAGFLLAGWMIPWTHHFGTRDRWTRDDTFALKYPMAEHLPAPLSFYGAWFDAMQFWLIDRFVCMRHQEHRAFFAHKQSELPGRAAGLEIPAKGLPIHVSGEVGWLGWTLPHVFIVDAFGLNDRYVARSRQKPHVRRLGHERVPPPGYIEAFRPNVDFVDGKWKVKKRKKKLRASAVERTERTYEVWLRHQD